MGEPYDDENRRMPVPGGAIRMRRRAAVCAAVPLPGLPAAERRAPRRGGAHAVGGLPHRPRRARRYVAKADSGNEVTRVFCGACGTPLYVQVSTRPDIVGVRVCTFDDASWFRPEANIFVKSAQPWDRLDPAVPAFPTYPTGKSY